ANLVGETASPASQVYLADLARPGVDALVQRESGSPWRGEQSRNLPDQTVSVLLLPSGPGAVHSFVMRLRNTGTDADEMILRARMNADPPEVTVATRNGLITNVTAEVIADGWRSPPVEPGAEVELVVTLAFRNPPTSDVQIDVQLVSSGNAWEHDAVRLVAMVDSDGDGLPDSWELAHFGSLAGSPVQDTDQDGLNDLAEWRSGTNPLDPKSGLHIASVLNAGEGSVEIRWEATAGRYYSVERRSEWGAAFVPLNPVPLPGINGLMRWTDT